MKKISIILMTILLTTASSALTQISNCTELQNMQNNLNEDYEIIQNIDCTGINFEPIGNTTIPFNGNINGNGYTINNLQINKPDSLYVGLISITGQNTSSYIKDIKLTNVNITGLGFTGALIGVSQNTTITNITISGNLQSYFLLGGIIGAGYSDTILEHSNSNTNLTSQNTAGGVSGVLSNSMITNSFSKGNINTNMTTGHTCGGITGIIEGNATIQDSNSTMNIWGDHDIGGITGITANNNNTINNTQSSGNITGATRIGGIAGYIQSNSTIQDSHSTGHISGQNEVGVLAGYNKGTIKNSYTSGTATGTSNVGGLVGINFNKITNSYSTSTVTGNKTSGGDVGGLVGDNYGGTINNSYVSGTEVSGNTVIGGISGNNRGSATITNSYTSGITIDGNSITGGIVGSQTANVLDSYSDGSNTNETGSTITTFGTGTGNCSLIGETDCGGECFNISEQSPTQLGWSTTDWNNDLTLKNVGGTNPGPDKNVICLNQQSDIPEGNIKRTIAAITLIVVLIAFIIKKKVCK